MSEVIREVAAETILFEMQDPRIKNVTVTRAEVAADLQHAKVYVSIMGTPKEQDLCLHGLRHSAGFIQSRLASRLKTRFTPTLKFVLDEGVKKSLEITRILKEAQAESAKAAPETAADTVKDKIVEDEIVEDEIVEDEIVEDKIVEDKIVEDKIVEDKIVEDRVEDEHA
ncbi:MAG: 30S ribosome-binding factor RbfA [Gemmataceae bacterium]|nr:30S ribosome-binding factor RbfA [Gemmataceae bacterium]